MKQRVKHIILFILAMWITILPFVAVATVAPTHRFYLRDYLGSTAAVIDENGDVLQSTAYFPSGLPLTPNNLAPQTIKLHTGKDYFGLQDAGWYDNRARYYDCILARFTTQDPLAEKYPWLSPYNHCANNPLRFVDRDGLKFHENMTEEQKQAYHEIVEPLFQHSSLFRMVYNFVDSHKDIITVQFGETVKDANGNHVPGQFDATNKTITFLNGQAPSSSTAIEEIYHSYQNLTPSSEDATTNFEFEAKTFTLLSSYEGNCLLGGDEYVLFNYSDFITNNMVDANNNLIYNSKILNSKYTSYGTKFVEYHLQINSGPNYTVPVNFMPSRLFNILGK